MKRNAIWNCKKDVLKDLSVSDLSERFGCSLAVASRAKRGLTYAIEKELRLKFNQKEANDIENTDL